MSETVKVACPGCNAIFEIPVELGGELGECTECDTVFEIPQINASKPEEEIKPIVPEMSAEDIEATGTVKLSRASIGMIPDLKDAFNFGVADDKSAVESSNMAAVFATPSQPVREPSTEQKPEPEKDNLRHGGLHIAKPKAPPAPRNVEPPEMAAKKKTVPPKPAPTPAAPQSSGQEGLANIESIAITEDGLSEKDKIVTLILCLFLGIFGAHRFYVGKIFTGFFMLITLGGVGVWSFIDLIMIVTDNFKDVDGLPMK